MARAVTLKDIARETGVHVSTVSRALDPAGRTILTEEVVQRVRDAAARLGYRPNRLASGLRTNRTMTVGLALPDITNTLFPPIVRGVESVLEPLGYAAIIVNTDGVPEREAALLWVLRERGVDGIIHAAARERDPALESLRAAGVPVVTVNRASSVEVPAVVNDDAGGILMMLRHLFGLGHRRIAHLGGPPALSTGRERAAAFRAAAGELGLDVPEAGIVSTDRFDEAEGERGTERLLAGGFAFTAILCANDRLALGALACLRRRGIRVPEDISVSGFNDIPFLDLIPPRLTTIRIQQFEVGAEGARLLVRRMGGEGEGLPAVTVLPVELVVRDSTAPPPATR